VGWPHELGISGYDSPEFPGYDSPEPGYDCPKPGYGCPELGFPRYGCAGFVIPGYGCPGYGCRGFGISGYGCPEPGYCGSACSELGSSGLEEAQITEPRFTVFTLYWLGARLCSTLITGINQVFPPSGDDMLSAQALYIIDGFIPQSGFASERTIVVFK
jgi:hypothetical protein